MPLTDKQKSGYISQLRAFLHAHLDDSIGLIECRRKDDGREVLVACIVSRVTVPPRILGGQPTETEQIIPIFEFVDPAAGNPYVSPDESMVEVAQPSGLVLPGANGEAEAVRLALEKVPS